ncbi:MAG: NAD(P)/FAD-dependent oxidoreductase [Balneolaceae bacterium]|nr:NAD(P)/FAD-dependent oxidoreductase [Balneolaceae bacterium]MCH8548777.1 NAD(P)/FAD-dependent oxidoreductase [Balneolaceae bacterium]
MNEIKTDSGKVIKEKDESLYSTHHQVLIVGGGSAGVTVAAQLRKKLKHSDIAIIDPAKDHFYQPLWTLAGVGVVDKEQTHRTMESVIPEGVVLIEDSVTEFKPDRNLLFTKRGSTYSYDYLVVAPGIQIDWDAIPGLSEGIGRNGISSIYSYRYVDYVNRSVQDFKGGTALFTQPNTKFKCGGAPQKIMYMAADTWRKKGLLDKAQVHFTSGGSTIFGVPEIAKALEKPIKRYSIKTHFLHNLREIRPDEKIAVYDIYKNGVVEDEKEMKFDFLHVTPPQGAPEFVKKSLLADSEGWVDVDKHTLQHVRYENVFSLGDAGNTPNAKTGAAIRKQSKVVSSNMASMIRKGELDRSVSYDGYGSCPLLTGYGKLILAEFDYNNKMTPSFPINQAKERRSMYHMKKDVLPVIYWQGMLKGRA